MTKLIVAFFAHLRTRQKIDKFFLLGDSSDHLKGISVTRKVKKVTYFETSKQKLCRIPTCHHLKDTQRENLKNLRVSK